MVDVEKQIDRIIDIRDGIDLNKVTILTGGNGCGKSMIRKQLGLICASQGVKSVSCSMDKRAGFDSNLGGFMVFSRDCEWLPTSINTFNSVENFYAKEDLYVILDEIEIGMSEESQYGIALYINKHLDEFKQKNRGMLIITHSRWLVRNIDADEFINIDGMTKEEWLNREIIPTDFDELNNQSSKLFRALQDKMESAAKKR